MRTGTEQKQNQTVGLDGGTRHMTTGAISAKSLVPEVGLEPTSLAAGDFESGQVCTRSTSYKKSALQTTLERLGNVGRGQKSALSSFMRPAHKRMSRMLGYCLTLGTADAWSDFAQVAAIRLTEIERASLTFALLRSLSPASAELTAGAALGAAGAPLPPFLGGMDEARAWASGASRAELKTHTLAGFEEMTPADQAAFFQHISEPEVAA